VSSGNRGLQLKTPPFSSALTSEIFDGQSSNAIHYFSPFFSSHPPPFFFFGYGWTSSFLVLVGIFYCGPFLPFFYPLCFFFPFLRLEKFRLYRSFLHPPRRPFFHPSRPVSPFFHPTPRGSSTKTSFPPYPPVCLLLVPSFFLEDNPLFVFLQYRLRDEPSLFPVFITSLNEFEAAVPLPLQSRCFSSLPEDPSFEIPLGNPFFFTVFFLFPLPLRSCFRYLFSRMFLSSFLAPHQPDGDSHSFPALISPPFFTTNSDGVLSLFLLKTQSVDTSFFFSTPIQNRLFPLFVLPERPNLSFFFCRSASFRLPQASPFQVLFPRQLVFFLVFFQLFLVPLTFSVLVQILFLRALHNPSCFFALVPSFIVSFFPSFSLSPLRRSFCTAPNRVILCVHLFFLPMIVLASVSARVLIPNPFPPRPPPPTRGRTSLLSGPFFLFSWFWPPRPDGLFWYFFFVSACFRISLLGPPPLLHKSRFFIFLCL